MDIKKDWKTEFKKQHVKEVAQGGVEIGNLHGIKFKEEVHKDVVFSSPEEVITFIDQLLKEREEEKEREFYEDCGAFESQKKDYEQGVTGSVWLKVDAYRKDLGRSVYSPQPEEQVKDDSI